MDPYTLRIVFSGLIAFVPVTGGGELQAVWGLLVNAREESPPCSAYGPYPDKAYHNHFPRLRFSTRNLTVTGADGVKRPLGGPDLEVTVDLAGKQIDLGLATRRSGERPALVGGGVVTGPSPVDDAGRSNFGWVAEVAHFAPDLAPVCEACIADDIEAVPTARITARLKLTAGAVGTAHIESNTKGEDVIYQFRSKAGDGSTRIHPSAEDPFQRARADRVDVTVRSVGTPVTLGARRTRHGSPGGDDRDHGGRGRAAGDPGP